MPDIYLILRDGATSEPLDPLDAEMMLEDGEITAEFYAFVEGMPEWRAVGEALVWARRELAVRCRDVINEHASLLVAGKVDTATSRLAIRDALWRRAIVTSDREMEALQTILETEAALRRSYDQYAQNFAPGAIDVFPAWELFDAHDSAFPRDWNTAWQKAGGREGGKVAAKADPVWARLSDFRFPFPPFSFDQSKWVRDVSPTDPRKYEITLSRQFTPKISPFQSVF